MSQKYLQNPDSRSIGTSESRVNLGLTILPPPLQEKARVQTQGQEVKERMEVRHANENRAIKVFILFFFFPETLNPTTFIIKVLYRETPIFMMG